MKIAIASLLIMMGLGLVVSLVLLNHNAGRPFAGQNNSHGSSASQVSKISGKRTYTLESDGVKREFIVYRPANLKADVETPVVFMYHGTNQTGEQFYNISGWTKKADQEGITVVYPTALKYHLIDDKELPSGEVVKESQPLYVTKWTHYKIYDMLDPDYPNQVVHDDVDFTQAMVDFMKENYPVDSSRFYATGFSNGAQFTSRLAVEMSDTFAAYATGGTGNLAYEDLTHINDHTDAEFVARPIMTGVGSVDPKVLRGLGLPSIPMDESLMSEDSGIKKAVVNPFLKLEGLEDSYVYELNGRVASYTFSEPLDEESDAQYTLLILDGMGHLYANGKNYPVVYANIYWPFFEQYSL